MTNYEIAKIIGERKIYDEFGIEVFDFCPHEFIEHAKLLQQHMVDNGWIVFIEQGRNGINNFRSQALVDDERSCCPGTPEVKFEADADIEPFAIVSLFEKIYGGKK